jgi:O-antigen/teichoic acid export membrane protein
MPSREDGRRRFMLGRLARDIGIFGGSDALARVVAFVTFPIIASALSVAEFGELELAITLVGMGGLVVRCGMNNAIHRFYWDRLTPKDQRPSLVTTGLIIIMALGVAVVLLAYIFHTLVLSSEDGHIKSIGTIGAVGLALLLPLTPWIQYLQDVLRLHFAPWKFIGFSFLTRSFSAIMTAVAVVIFHGGVGGALFTQAIVLLVAFPLGLWLIRQDITKKVERIWAKRLIAFGSPFIMTEAAFWLFSSIDRWMLATMVGMQEVGLYSAAFRISVVATFISLAFGMAWNPYAMKLKSEHPTGYKRIYVEVLVLLIVVMLLSGGGIALFAGELLAMLVPADFAGAATPLTILAFCVVVQASQQITAAGISLSLKSHLFMYLVWGAAGINALLNFLMIPSMGAIGAAWATLIAHLILTCGYLVCGQYVYPLPFPIIRLLYLTGIGAVLLACALMLQSNELSFTLIVIKLVILLGCISLAWLAVRLQALKLI